jgi:CheY-like chemotaxis protein
MKKITCLLFDDEAESLQILTEIASQNSALSLKGSFTDAQIGSDYALKNQVDLIITDLNIPRISGLDLLGKLHQHSWFVFSKLRVQSKMGKFTEEAQALCPKPVDIPKIMRIISIVFLLFLLKISDCYSQCECYSIKKISISQEVKEKVEVTFYNECDINVYLQFWLIIEKDTIARFDKCSCGSIPIKSDNEIYYLDTKLTKLPPLNSLRVALSNGTLNCPSIKFSPELLALGTDDLDNNKTLIYPNPTEDTVFNTTTPF